MAQPKVEIIQCEEGETPAELMYEADGVWMTGEDFDKRWEARQREIDRFSTIVGLAFTAIVGYLGIWLIKG